MVEEETFVSLELVPPISVISPWCFQASLKCYKIAFLLKKYLFIIKMKKLS